MANALIHFALLADLEEEEEEDEEGELQFDEESRRHKPVDPFSMSDIKFAKVFRLSKALATNLIEELSEFMPPPTRVGALDISTRVLVALRFFAVGEYQTGIGIGKYFAISQKSVSNAIIEVSDAINVIMPRWVNFPDNILEQTRIMRGFKDKYNFPGIVGIIDCTHVELIAPPTNDPVYAEHNYVNRKGVHSINVQLVCDDNMRILHVNALYPGSTSDKFIWRMCNLKQYFVDRFALDPNMGCWLLGDSGYNLEPWMMITNNRALPNTPDDLFNQRQRVVRCTIERCNGLLKARFRCTLKHRVLHYHPERATKIINSCVVLHNMCVDHNLELQLDSDEEDADSSDGEDEEEAAVDVQPQVGPHRNPVLVAGERVRNRLIARHFT